MGKSKRSDTEFTREQKLVHENQQLKRKISSLRKQIARIDLDKYGQLKETIEQHFQEDKAQEGQDLLEKVKKEWACREPSCEGYLEIILYNKIDQLWYYRKCNNCPNRTKAQKYDKASVKGIIKESK